MPHAARGFALLDALVAMALLGLAAAGAAGIVHHAARVAVEAARLDAGRGAAAGLLTEMRRTPWVALPHAFGAGHGQALATLDTGAGTLGGPEARSVTGLPEGRMTATLEGLGPGGAAAAFGDALVLRVRVEASWRTSGGARRRVVLDDWRF